MRYKNKIICFLISVFFVFLANIVNAALPEGLLYLDEVLPNVAWDARYYSSDNFTGQRVTGYEANRVVISERMLEPLRQAANKAAELNYKLLVFDATRPQRAVDRFVAWSHENENGLTKKRFYPRIDNKYDLFKNGFIASRSKHTQGRAIDLTLVDENGKMLDMGGHFDLFDAQSGIGANLNLEQVGNRWLLSMIMKKARFFSYNEEWWHFYLANSEDMVKYYDFVIEPKNYN